MNIFIDDYILHFLLYETILTRESYKRLLWEITVLLCNIS